MQKLWKVIVSLVGFLLFRLWSATAGEDNFYDPCTNPDPQLISGEFPKDFLWSVATSAYQSEGGWNASGKGPSNWDTYTHVRPSKILDGSTGDVTDDSFHHWRSDVHLLKELRVSHYRISLSWSRIFPKGIRSDGINWSGVAFYNQLINELSKNGIQPIVTLYHWDLPQSLEDNGGWLNSSIADWFEDFAEFAFTSFGDRVPIWITINEPYFITYEGYGNGRKAPGITSCPKTCPYTAARNVLIAHAKAYRLYDRKFKHQFGGQVGIVNTFQNGLPASPSPEDNAATQLKYDFDFGLFTHPIFSRAGDYPDSLKRILASRIPKFTDEEILMIQGSSDFFGLNYYSGKVVRYDPDGDSDLNYTAAECKNLKQDGIGLSTPWMFRALLNDIKNRYDNPRILITENGLRDGNGSLDDSWRIVYLRENINVLLKDYYKMVIEDNGFSKAADDRLRSYVKPARKFAPMMAVDDRQLVDHLNSIREHKFVQDSYPK